MPTLAELYADERGPMNERVSKDGPYWARGRHALEAFKTAQNRLRAWRAAFPDTVDPDKLARYQLAKAYPKRLKSLMPTWAKTKPIPRRIEFTPDLPPKFPAWVNTRYPNALHFHQSHA